MPSFEIVKAFCRSSNGNDDDVGRGTDISPAKGLLVIRDVTAFFNFFLTLIRRKSSVMDYILEHELCSLHGSYFEFRILTFKLKYGGTRKFRIKYEHSQGSHQSLKCYFLQLKKIIKFAFLYLRSFLFPHMLPLVLDHLSQI